MCADGTKCAVTDFTSHKCVVYDITDLTNITAITTREVEDVLSSDISNDGSKVVCAGKKGVKLYDISKVRCAGWRGMKKLFNVLNKQPPITLREEWTNFVRFLNEPQGLLYADGDCRVHLMDDMSGLVLRSFSGTHHERSLTLIDNDKWLVTGNYDNSINIHDVETGKIIYKFYHPSSDGFRRGFTYNPNSKKLIGCTWRGKLFVLITH